MEQSEACVLILWANTTERAIGHTLLNFTTTKMRNRRYWSLKVISLGELMRLCPSVFGMPVRGSKGKNSWH
jgi:hypothetical protein